MIPTSFVKLGVGGLGVGVGAAIYDSSVSIPELELAFCVMSQLHYGCNLQPYNVVEV